MASHRTATRNPQQPGNEDVAAPLIPGRRVHK
jgi:hypothetical protein